MKIGFIGLGIMGRPMAKNLLKAGYDLMITSRTIGPAVAELQAAGAVLGSKDEIAAECDVVMTMLPDGPDVEKVMLIDDKVGEKMRPGSVFIDMSSISPVVSRRIGDALEARGVDMLDAPVSGGEPKAIDGTLAFMVGGKQHVFDKYKDILACMGSSVVLCGDIGAGNTTKLTNQIIVALNIAAVSEAFMLAAKSGLDPKVVFEAIRGGLAGSTVMNAKMPMILEGNFKPGFKIGLHIKDLRNAIEAASAVDSPIPLTGEVMSMLKELAADGYGQNDHSGIAMYYEKISGKEIRSNT